MEPATPLIAYTIVQRKSDGRRFWLRIGTAVRASDGSTTVNLDALPVNGSIVLRPMAGIYEGADR